MEFSQLDEIILLFFHTCNAWKERKNQNKSEKRPENGNNLEVYAYNQQA